jgi:succinate dehydrogenase/fumarate reductase flavoprotein subunit
LESQIETAPLGDVRDKKLKFDLLSAVFVLRAVLIASLGRKESRGGFVRKDCPDTDDVNWQKNSCLTYHPDSRHLELSHHPVAETVADYETT